MRLVQLDDEVVVDADRIVGLVEHAYTQPTPDWRVYVYLHGMGDRSLIVKGRLSDVMVKLRTGPDLTK